MTGAEACPQCGAPLDDPHTYGRCPDQPGPVQIAVGVTVRRWFIPATAVVLAAAALFGTGYLTGRNAPRGCTYGTLRLRNGDVAASSVPGVDAECKNGTMVRYVPTARPYPSPTAV